MWRHRIMVNGKRVSGSFDTKVQALAWEAEQRVELSSGTKGAVNKTCAEAFEKYELEVSKTKRGYRWEALRLTAMARTSLGPIKIADLRPGHIAAWRDQRLREVRGGSVTREINLLFHTLFGGQA